MDKLLTPKGILIAGGVVAGLLLILPHVVKGIGTATGEGLGEGTKSLVKGILDVPMVVGETVVWGDDSFYNKADTALGGWLPFGTKSPFGNKNADQ